MSQEVGVIITIILLFSPKVLPWIADRIDPYLINLVPQECQFSAQYAENARGALFGVGAAYISLKAGYEIPANGFLIFAFTLMGLMWLEETQLARRKRKSI